MATERNIIGKRGIYSSDDSMAKLMCDHNLMLLVMTRFNIPLGFAHKSIANVCLENGVDCPTFLAIVNLVLRGDDISYLPKLDNIMTHQVISYLRSSHDYYLSVRLPKIRQKLTSVLDQSKISSLIIRYFDDYVLQIEKHLRFEEEQLFPYVENLCRGEKMNSSPLGKFCQIHDHIDEPLTEFKDVIIKYYNSSSCQEVVEVILDIFSCANELSKHNMVEDRLLVPLIKKIEFDAQQ